MPPFYLQFCTAKLHESKTCSKSCHPWHNFCAGMGLRYAIGLEPSTGASGGVREITDHGRFRILL